MWQFLVFSSLAIIAEETRVDSLTYRIIYLCLCHIKLCKSGNLFLQLVIRSMESILIIFLTELSDNLEL